MNINEIAKLAGVSRATVSRYLNNGYVSDEKKERIQEVIDRTGYKPSTQAQTLRTKKTRLIGVILPKINSDSISRMVAGISVVLKEAGYQLLLANTENREKEELEYLRLFSENHVDGIILIATIITREHKRALKALQVPVVLLGQRLDGYSCVYQDDCLAARDVSRLLLRGAGKIGCIGVTQQDEAVGAGRRKGFLEAGGGCRDSGRRGQFPGNRLFRGGRLSGDGSAACPVPRCGRCFLRHGQYCPGRAGQASGGGKADPGRSGAACTDCP